MGNIIAKEDINEFISKATLTEQFLSLRLVRNPYSRKIPDKRE